MSKTSELLSHSDVVFCHAHPDDEAFLTAGLMQRLAARGARTKLLYLAAGGPDRHTRMREAREAADILGIDEVEASSIADGTLSDNEQAARAQLAESLSSSDLLVHYDINGGYGHPDHRAVHRIAATAGANAKTATAQATFDTAQVRDLIASAPVEERPDTSFWTLPSVGSISGAINVRLHLTRSELMTKRTALACHRSQHSASDFPLSLGDKSFRRWFGVESYILDVP